MKNIISILTFLVGMICSAQSDKLNYTDDVKTDGVLTSAQVKFDEDPKNLVEEFLKTLKIIDIPEGKLKAKTLTFDNIKEFPSIVSFQILYSDYFKTDIENIDGYKSLVNISNGNVDRKYILIAYKLINSKVWKVFEFRETVDIDYETESVSKDIDLNNSEPPRKQYKYRNFAYWLIMRGEINKARNVLDESIKIAKADKDDKFEPKLESVLKQIIN